MLHGQPDEHTYLNLTGGPANESWHYKRPDGSEFLFHFVKTEDSVGYRRVASLMDILAMTKPARATGQANLQEKTANGQAIETYGAGWLAQTAQDLLYSRAQTSPIYARMLSNGVKDAASIQAAERTVGDASLAHAETWSLGYELPLEAKLDVIAVGSDASGPLVQVAFAIPGTSLYAPPTDGRVVYPVRMRATIFSGTKVVARVDSLRNFVAAQAIPLDAVLFGRLPLPVPPGDYTVEVSLETPSRGMTAPLQHVRVAAVNGAKLDLSDLALGARSVHLQWFTPAGDSAWVNPLREFHGHEPMQLYFEVAGVPGHETFHIALAIFKSGGEQPQLQLGFDAQSLTTPDAIHQAIDIGKLAPGAYELQVTVSTTGGATASRRREFIIVK
jgi:hypothetical protein